MAVSIPIDLRSRFIGHQTVTYTVHETAGDSTYSFSNGNIRPVGGKEVAASNGIYVSGDARLVLPRRWPVGFLPIAITSITDSGGEALVTTAEAHGLTNEQEISLTNTGNHVYDGSWLTDDYTVVNSTSFILGSGLYDADASGGTLTYDNAVFPKPGDSYEWRGTTYKVFEISQGVIAAHVKCLGRNLAIAFGLKDTVDLQHPTITTGNQAGKSYSWADVRTDIYCRVQPESDEPFEERGSRGVARRWNVYLDPTTGTGSTFAVKNATGDMGRLVFGSLNLMIESFEDAERLVDLPVCRCRSVP